MPWIYLSPHFDDVALSCGGLVWEQAQHGEQVNIWTVCAGRPPAGVLSPFAKELHSRWSFGRNAPARRRSEDIRSCHRLGAAYKHISIPDCIYRRDPQTLAYLYTSLEALSGPLQPGDLKLIQVLHEQLTTSLKHEAVVVCPLAIGNHVDHQLTRQAVMGLGFQIWHYADYPYVLQSSTQLDQMEKEGWESQVFPITQEGLEAWTDSIYAHGSQISTFWADEAEMRDAIMNYWSSSSGIRLWRKPAS